MWNQDARLKKPSSGVPSCLFIFNFNFSVWRPMTLSRNPALASHHVFKHVNLNIAVQRPVSRNPALASHHVSQHTYLKSFSLEDFNCILNFMISGVATVKAHFRNDLKPLSS